MNQKLLTILVIVVLLVGGIFVWNQTETPITPVINDPSESTQEENKNLPDTSDWKSYVNKEYDFEIKYPKNWDVDKERSSDNEIVFETGFSGSREAIYFEKNIRNISHESWIKMNRDKYQGTIINEKNIQIDGLNAYEIETGDFAQKYIVFSNKKFLYVIATMGLMEKNYILKTFRLTDSD